MSEGDSPDSTRQTEEPPSSRSGQRQIPSRVWAAAAHIRERLTASAVDDIWARLRRYARVTERITSNEFTELLQLRDRHGRPLSWSHFEKLAEAPGADMRRRCATEIIVATLSVHQVGACLRALRGHVREKPFLNRPPAR
jgi:hypothetical protein